MVEVSMDRSLAWSWGQRKGKSSFRDSRWKKLQAVEFGNLAEREGVALHSLTGLSSPNSLGGWRNHRQSF